MAIQQQIIKGHFNCKSSYNNSMTYDNRFSFVDVSLPQKKTLILKPKVERYHIYIMNVIKVIVITLKSLTALIEKFYIRRKFNQSRKYYIK